MLIFVVAFCFGRKSNKKVLKQAKGALEAQKLESKAIERSHKIEIKQREKARKKYELALSKVEQAHRRRVEGFDDAKKKEMQKNLKLAKNNPNEIDKILFKEFGLREVK
jgi:flagellar biosynthesis/type III secretory pathway M-ring protein FliF/YscJ